MLNCIYYFIFLFIAATYGISPVFAADGIKPIIVLDPGHTPKQPGALGIRGIYEVTYNDQFVAKLSKSLRDASFSVVVTRQSGECISLTDRVEMATSIQPKLFLSIHHDSTQTIYLKKIHIEQGIAYKTIRKISGYSIFVSKINKEFANSYHFAEELGKSLLKLKRPPTLHHAENIAGEQKELLNKDLGIYRFDNLIVLSKTKIPSVLLELGVIVDDDDEHYVSDLNNQDAICRAIVEAINSTLSHLKM